MKTTRAKVMLSVGAFAALAVVAATPQLLGSHVATAFGSLAGADRPWLALGALGFLGGFVCTVGAWHAALRAAGGKICPKQAAARLGVGALVNSFAPAKLGDAVKIALCSKAIEGPGRMWATGGVYAGLGAARCLTLAALLVVASTTGALPLWPVFALAGLVALLAGAATFSGRLRTHPRIAQLLGSLQALERSPRALAVVLAWTSGMVVARLCGTIAITAALGLPHPVLAALLILPALDVAAAFPLTPGNVGVGSGAVAVALASRGIGMTQALGVGLAIQAVETAVSVGTGTLGGLYLAQPNENVRRWTMRVATVGASAALAGGLGLMLDLL